MLRKILRWLRLMDDPAHARRLSPEDLAKLARLNQMHAAVDRRRSEASDTQWRNGRRP